MMHEWHEIDPKQNNQVLPEFGVLVFILLKPYVSRVDRTRWGKIEKEIVIGKLQSINKTGPNWVELGDDRYSIKFSLGEKLAWHFMDMPEIPKHMRR